MEHTKKIAGKLHKWKLVEINITLKDALKQVPGIKTSSVFRFLGVLERKGEPYGGKFRSSVILDIDYHNGIIETKNSLYFFDPAIKDEVTDATFPTLPDFDN